MPRVESHNYYWGKKDEEDVETVLDVGETALDVRLPETAMVRALRENDKPAWFQLKNLWGRYVYNLHVPDRTEAEQIVYLMDPAWPHFLETTRAPDDVRQKWLATALNKHKMSNRRDLIDLFEPVAASRHKGWIKKPPSPKE